jgi:hypothetical protein
VTKSQLSKCKSNWRPVCSRWFTVGSDPLADQHQQAPFVRFFAAFTAVPHHPSVPFSAHSLRGTEQFVVHVLACVGWRRISVGHCLALRKFVFTSKFGWVPCRSKIDRPSNIIVNCLHCCEMASASASGTPVSRTDPVTSAPLKALSLDNPLARSAEGHHFVADTLRAETGSQGFVLSGAAHYGRGSVPPQAPQTAAAQWYAHRNLKPSVVGPFSHPPSPSGIGKRDSSEVPSRLDANPAAVTRARTDVTEIRPQPVPSVEPRSFAPPPQAYATPTVPRHEPVAPYAPYNMSFPHPYAAGLRGGDAGGSTMQMPRELERSAASGADGGFYPHASGPYMYDAASGTYVPLWPRWPGPGYVGFAPGSSRFVSGPPAPMPSMPPGPFYAKDAASDHLPSRESTTPRPGLSTAGEMTVAAADGTGGDSSGAQRPQYRCGQCGEVKRGHFCTVRYKS